jgi:hypothetical protein
MQYSSTREKLNSRGEVLPGTRLSGVSSSTAIAHDARVALTPLCAFR